MPRITLEAARINSKLTQAELANKMGVSRESIIAWESGKRKMRTPYVYLFCQITGFSANDIILPEESILTEPKGGV